MVESSYDSHSSTMPVPWTAPEGLQSKHFSSKSDVWSMGIVLWVTSPHIFLYNKIGNVLSWAPPVL
jgi:serine/threonine protein kinase